MPRLPLLKHIIKKPKKMRKANYTKTEMTANNDIYEGQSVERYVEQATTSKQPIEGGAPMIYTRRADGVLPEHNIRTDRWQIAQDAMDKVSGSYRASRMEFIKSQQEKTAGTDSNGENVA